MALVEIGGEPRRRPSMGDTTTNNKDDVPDADQQQHRASARQRRACDIGDSICAAIAEPPSVWSPFSSSSTSPLLPDGCAAGSRRKLVHQTPQHVATLQVPSSSGAAAASSSSKTATINAISSSFALAPPLIYQEKYVIQALSSGKIAFWMLSNKHSIFCGYQPGDRYKNSTFRKTPLHPDFVLDITGASANNIAPLVELAKFFANDGDDEQEADATTADNHSIANTPPRRYADILALSTLGEVFCISVQSSSTTTKTTTTNVETTAKSSSSSSTTTTKSLACTASVIFSWNTGRAGATCLTTTCPSRSHAKRDSGARRGRNRHERQVLIGYQSGHLEAWRIIRVVNVNTSDKDDTERSGNAAAESAAATFTTEKLWTGVFDHHFPIHSLLIVPAARTLKSTNRGPTAIRNNTATATINGGDRDGEAQHVNGNNEQYLALTLHPPTRLSTPAYLEIINLTAVQQQATAQHNAKHHPVDNEVGAMVPLENHWVLPLPGKEIRDPAVILRGGASGAAAAAVNGGLRSRGKNKRASNTASSAATAASSVPRTVHWIPSNSTNRLCSLVGSSCNGCNGPNFAVALADGTVGLMSATLVELSNANGNDMDENNNDNNNGGSCSRLDWGISNQLLLSYPCIGLGTVDLQLTPHAVCALRGGTVCFVPLVADTVERRDDHGNMPPPPPPPPLTVITYPDELDTDTVMQHLQAFVAGMVVSDTDSSDASEIPSQRLPLLFFSWPGGVIDVYSCHLFRSDAQVDRLALGELLANGSVDSLKSLLLSYLGVEHGSDSRADLIQALGSSDSFIARREIEGLNGKALTTKDLAAEKLKTFRSILLRFAERESCAATLE